MLSKLLISMALVLIFVSEASLADEIVTWVDEQGVTHFGNAQFAPAGTAQDVLIEPANAMDVPDMSVLRRAQPNRAGNVTVLKRSKLENPRGWRGHYGRQVQPRSRSSHNRARLRR